MGDKSSEQFDSLPGNEPSSTEQFESTLKSAIEYFKTISPNSLDGDGEVAKSWVASLDALLRSNPDTAGWYPLLSEQLGVDCRAKIKKAIADFDPDKGKFSHYLWRILDNAVKDREREDGSKVIPEGKVQGTDDRGKGEQPGPLKGRPVRLGVRQPPEASPGSPPDLIDVLVQEESKRNEKKTEMEFEKLLGDTARQLVELLEQCLLSWDAGPKYREKVNPSLRALYIEGKQEPDILNDLAKRFCRPSKNIKNYFSQVRSRFNKCFHPQAQTVLARSGLLERETCRRIFPDNAPEDLEEAIVVLIRYVKRYCQI